MAVISRNLKKIWSIKPKYAVAGARSCAELTIAGQLACDGWGAVWVSAFAGVRLWNRCFPAEGLRTITEAGVAAWVAHIFDRLRRRTVPGREASSKYSGGAGQTRSGSSR